MTTTPASERPSLDRPTHDLPGQDRHIYERQADHVRRDHIAAAAERAFVRHGFHAATMQQVAEEAGMSAGNLYRYFPSKEALVEGICLLDQRERGAVFHALAHSGDVLGMLEAMLRDNLLCKPREKAVMFLEVAAEAGRNPRVAEMMRTNDAEVIGGLTSLIEIAKANGETAADLDPYFAARLMFNYVGGLFRRRALDERFDVEEEAAMTMALLRALFAGAISSSNPTETP
ncbi:MAG: TetR/AcrR family transcriptional regulator [Roseiarcus sp.]|jgi:AcrR family transcriptional regulator|uniref:TetR/AcrR family transcriptional regulator n=1 Tax=Roseiarcus sp. TaxID=1969460 RepID=UPI003C25737F